MKFLKFIFLFILLKFCSTTRLSTKNFLSASHQLRMIDPDYNRTISEIITSRGYRVETHYVETIDGYILKLFRIPSAKNSSLVNKKLCLMLHGMLDSSDSFVLHYESKSYSYVMANSGYDVWIGNNRGNKHSRNHSHLNPDNNTQFWNFSFHEMGKFDLPAMIDYILKTTNQTKLTYIGHSQGSMQLFSAASENSDYFAKRVNGVIALGPATKLGNLRSKFLYFLAKVRIDKMLSFLNINEFLSNSKALTKFNAFVCEKLLFICDGIVGLLADSNPLDDDQYKLPTFFTHFPAGSSLKAFSHLIQSIRSDKFARYNYGDRLNFKLYGVNKPPEYDLKNIRGLKFCLFVGKDDQMATIKDSRWIRDQIKKNNNLHIYKEIENMGHLTFFIPKNVDYFNQFKDCLKEFEK